MSCKMSNYYLMFVYFLYEYQVYLKLKEAYLFMSMYNNKDITKIIYEIQCLRKFLFKLNLIDLPELSDIEFCNFLNWTGKNPFYKNQKSDRNGLKYIFIATIVCLIVGVINFSVIEYLLTVRCFIPNNYLIYEATRPIEMNCKFCAGITRPIILTNITRNDFKVL